ncbi:MAG: hypothetical protein ACM3JD_03335 [Rudaea sp.]
MTNPTPGDSTRVILFGVGSIGGMIARVLLDRKGFEIVGAVDNEPHKVNCDVGRLAGLRRDIGVLVSSDAKDVLAEQAELVVHSASSFLGLCMPDLTQSIRAGHNVVSTCEELAEPWAENWHLADELDHLAKKMGVTVLGTGVNPGFAMDAWPLVLTAVCQQVNRIRVRRVVDASRRRMQLQKKVGAGQTAVAFQELAAQRQLRHIGLVESAALIARGLGFKLDKIEESIEPILAKRRIVTDYFTIEPGFVAGVNQTARGFASGIERVTLELVISCDAPESTDEVWIDGRPNLQSSIKGIHGDMATAAVVANAARRVIAAPPGLLTMADLPIPTAYQ